MIEIRINHIVSFVMQIYYSYRVMSWAWQGYCQISLLCKAGTALNVRNITTSWASIGLKRVRLAR